jgi:hypothetical protein
MVSCGFIYLWVQEIGNKGSKSKPIVVNSNQYVVEHPVDKPVMQFPAQPIVILAFSDAFIFGDGSLFLFLPGPQLLSEDRWSHPRKTNGSAT